VSERKSGLENSGMRDETESRTDRKDVCSAYLENIAGLIDAWSSVAGACSEDYYPLDDLADDLNNKKT
jgi:hypothetical protein